MTGSGCWNTKCATDRRRHKQNAVVVARTGVKSRDFCYEITVGWCAYFMCEGISSCLLATFERCPKSDAAEKAQGFVRTVEENYHGYIPDGAKDHH